MTDREKAIALINNIVKYFPVGESTHAISFITEQLEKSKAVGYIQGQNDLLPIVNIVLEKKFQATYHRSVN